MKCRHGKCHGMKLGINSSLSGQSHLWMGGGEGIDQPLRNKRLGSRGVFFFCSPYPLSAMETGTEAVLSVASGIGSRAIVFVVTPAAPPASACQLLCFMLCFVFSPQQQW